MTSLYKSAKASIAVLVSGGLDSGVLLAEMSKRASQVIPIYIRQGLAWEPVELYWLNKYISALRKWPPSPYTLSPGRGEFHKARSVRNQKRRFQLTSPWGEVGRSTGEGIKPLIVLALPMADVYGSHWSTGKKPVPGHRSKDAAVFLPGRNLILSVKAAVYCAMQGIHGLAIGSLDHNPFPDASPAFFRLWSKALSQGIGRSIRIQAPYRSMEKAEVIRRGVGLPLDLTFSCLAPQGRAHCGQCNKCAERRKAFVIAGRVDKTMYAKT